MDTSETDKLFKQSQKRIKVMIAIPNTGWTITGLETQLTRWIMERNYDVNQLFKNISPVAANRNLIAKDFLKTDCDFLLMIDTDTMPSINPLDLIKHDKDIVSGVTPTWKETRYAWAVCWKDKDGSYKQYPTESRKGLQRVEAVGASCLLIKRKVLEQVPQPFVDKWDEDGTMILGEDFYFCEKAKEKGFEIWADWDLVCNHYKEIPLLSVIDALRNSYKEGYELGKSLDKNIKSSNNLK